MKKLLFPALLAAVLLTACAAGDTSSETSDAPAQETVAEQPTATPVAAPVEKETPTPAAPLQTIQSGHGAQTVDTAASVNGVLTTLECEGEAFNWTLAQYPEGEKSAPCTIEGCAHDGEGCPAWVYSANANARLFSVNGTLLTVSENEDNTALTFTATQPDGSGRKVAATLSGSQLSYDFFAARGSSVFFTVIENGSARVVELNLQTGADTAHLQLQASQAVVGTLGGELVYTQREDGQDTVTLAKTAFEDAGTEEPGGEPLLEYKQSECEMAYFDESVYLYQRESGEVKGIDLASGVETSIATVAPIGRVWEDGPTDGLAHFVTKIGNTLVFDVVLFGADASDDNTTRYLLDANGREEPRECTLTTSHTGSYTYTEPLRIVADTGDALLVCSTVHHGQQTLTGTDGGEYTAPHDQKRFTLLEYEDFLSNNANYQGDIDL